jgi:acyl-CoA thioester hydrolase
MPVQWGDMDALNHVNHTVFIRWMETARMHYFVACGFTDLLEDKGVGPILAGLKVDYLAPVTFPDTMTIHTTITRMGDASFDMGYRITSSARDGDTVATATVYGVAFDYETGKTARIPDELRAMVFEIEASAS